MCSYGVEQFMWWFLFEDFDDDSDVEVDKNMDESNQQEGMP